ncbi:uncharacterized protein BP5553_01142 [Venustampulla echinocandica]|uniref:Uncharacterized protein n=1 Tax=Venustampulla echinocandica TaxID=2656787 RepID=A0A370U076_9HELO|nr:uncharacterized protein BP5553_01142 [Venustampulla echinocandica]RDL41163.1 hypothetical protein BP5553_01142 [Venustampulla echinocandica]
MSDIRINPLTLTSHRNKILPMLPPPPSLENIAALEQENRRLRMEVQQLRSQQEIWANQVRRYYQIAEAAKEFARGTASGVRLIQDATNNMEKAKKVAGQSWNVCESNLEALMADEKVGNWI